MGWNRPSAVERGGELVDGLIYNFFDVF